MSYKINAITGKFDRVQDAASLEADGETEFIPLSWSDATKNLVLTIENALAAQVEGVFEVELILPEVDFTTVGNTLFIPALPGLRFIPKKMIIYTHAFDTVTDATYVAILQYTDNGDNIRWISGGDTDEDENDFDFLSIDLYSEYGGDNYLSLDLSRGIQLRVDNACVATEAKKTIYVTGIVQKA
ncbi:MAG: hypothetical protein WC389_18245 [Lutibacter sp.]|jgi:hypothetical protein